MTILRGSESLVNVLKPFERVVSTFRSRFYFGAVINRNCAVINSNFVLKRYKVIKLKRRDLVLKN